MLAFLPNNALLLEKHTLKEENGVKMLVDLLNCL